VGSGSGDERLRPARFESKEASRHTRDRPEQVQWWAEIPALSAGQATFRESDDVTHDVNGDPDNAGFVQVIQGRSSDPERVRELMERTRAPGPSGART